MPKVSVVLLSHRHEFLPGAIASIAAQTHGDIQLIVNHDSGPIWPTKFNDIADAAVGEWLVPYCDDDLLDPTYIQTCLRYAKGADVVYTDRRVFQDGANPREGFWFHTHGPAFVDKKFYPITLLPQNFAFGASLPMTIMVRREWWKKLGGYDTQAPHTDTEFFFRSAMAGAKFHYIPLPLFWYREHPKQFSRTEPSMLNAMRYFHRKYFAWFGMLFDDASQMPDGRFQVSILPPEHRAEYARAHHYPQTMPQETRVLPDIAKTAIKLQMQASQAALDSVVMQALAREGLLGQGWLVNDQLDCVRTTPDVPVANLAPTPDVKNLSPEDKSVVGSIHGADTSAAVAGSESE
ncbi:MAG: hypothetical protein NUW01_09745 [Gemmatimonadaceae bacterium]|nr:hypothetical protein [Gemmatimonadaceae bacterium]